MRVFSAALMILPLFTGVAVGIGHGEVVYKIGDDEALITASLGALLAGAAAVVFFALEAMPADPRGASRLVLGASMGATLVLVGHDVRSGPGISLVCVFFVPAAAYALARGNASPTGRRELLLAARKRLTLAGCATGLLAAHTYFEAGRRGLAADPLMIVASICCAGTLIAALWMAFADETERATLVTGAAAIVGLVGLRDYFIAQAALLGGVTYLSHRLTHIARVAGAGPAPVARTANA